MSDPIVEVVAVGDRRLTCASWGRSPSRIVMLHDGLGSIAQWRDVPARIAAATGVGVMAYDRAGHGCSTPVPTDAWPVDWLHREADVLGELIAHTTEEPPILVGHSDGGSIALLHAARHAPCTGVVALAAHSFVEQRCIDAIEEMRARPQPIIDGLARHHDAPEALLRAWTGVWTSEAFRTWDIRPMLGAVDCPTLIVQGDADEYATDDQLVATVEAIGDGARLERISGVGHVLHHRVPDLVTDLVVAFHRDVARTESARSTAPR